MKTALLLLLFAFCVSAADAEDAAAPFKLEVIPSQGTPKGQEIEIDKLNATKFYAVLTNISREPQTVFEHWNSWGEGAISFKFTTADGTTFVASFIPQIHTRNFPSTFLILPGEHQVYEFKLNKDWEIKPSFPRPREPLETPVDFKAIYRTHPSPEATQSKLWIGSVESKSYNVTLTH